MRESHRPDWVSEKRCQHGRAEVSDAAEEWRQHGRAEVSDAAEEWRRQLSADAGCPGWLGVTPLLARRLVMRVMAAQVARVSECWMSRS